MTANIRMLMRVTAVLEGITGCILAVVPALIVPILLNTSLDDPLAVFFARLAGAALVTIAIACWFSRTRKQSTLMTMALLGYNGFSSCLLVYAAVVQEMSGPGLWPTVILHVGLFIWCLLVMAQRGGHSFTQSRMEVVARRKSSHSGGYQEAERGDDWKTSASILKLKPVWKKTSKGGT